MITLAPPEHFNAASQPVSGTQSRLLGTALALMLVLAFLLRVLPLTYSHFWDETVFLQNAKVIFDGRTNYDEFFERPPLLSLVYALGFLFWNNVYVANLMQGLFTTLAVLFAFLYTRETLGTLVGLCAAFLMAFAPYFVETSHELLTDMPAVALMLAAMWLFEKRGAWSALLAGVTYGLAIETRFTSLFLLLYFLLQVAFAPRKVWRLVLTGLAATATLTPYLIWLNTKYGSFFYPFVLARRIVHEWTAPVPAAYYFEALRTILPLSLWLLVAVALGSLVRQWLAWARDRASVGPGRESLAQLKQLTTLLIWGTAFFAYMLSIPHKETRYLLPLAVPAVVMGAVSMARLYEWLASQRTPVRVAGLLLVLSVVAAEYGSPLLELAGPFVDPTESAEVQIAQYLREHAAPPDTIYAAHNFPVLAFYSGRRTVSLLPIQENFDREWPDFMTQPGFFVYFLPEHIGEIHALHPALKPDRQFLELHPNFIETRAFATAIVYRYVPPHTESQ